jgi:hypothetical protein
VPQTADIRGKRPVAPDPPGAYIPLAFPVIADDVSGFAEGSPFGAGGAQRRFTHDHAFDA